MLKSAKSLTLQVESVPRQVLHDFWKRWYFPGNATLYLVGDFESGSGGGMDAAENLIRETFGRIPAGRLPGNGVPGPLKHRQLVSRLFLMSLTSVMHAVSSVCCI